MDDGADDDGSIVSILTSFLPLYFRYRVHFEGLIYFEPVDEILQLFL